MITPYLESKIHEGLAEYKTFSVGGSQKHILGVEKNSYIIIVQLIYFPVVNGRNIDDVATIDVNRITQLNIFDKAQKSFNNFVFRNNITEIGTPPANNRIFGGTPIVIPTYLIMETDVSFTFAKGQNLTSLSLAVSEGQAPTLAPPSDYGGVADPGAIPVHKITRSAVGDEIYQGGRSIKRGTGAGQRSYEQLQFPVNVLSQPPYPLEVQGMPIVQVGYVKVYGRMPVKLKS
jgi:hypothetical protein